MPRRFREVILFFLEDEILKSEGGRGMLQRRVESKGGEKNFNFKVVFDNFLFHFNEHTWLNTGIEADFGYFSCNFLQNVLIPK